MDNEETTAAFIRSAEPVSAQQAIELARKYIRDKEVEPFREIIKHIPQDNLSALLAVAFKRIEAAQEHTHNYYSGLVHGRIARDKNMEQSLYAKRESAFVKFKFFADILIDAGAQIGWRNHKGENFMHRCARWNAHDVIKWAVVEKKFTGIDDLVTGDSHRGYTALHIACGEKSIDSALELVRLGADFKILTPGGKEPGELLKGDHLQDEFYDACHKMIIAENADQKLPEPVPQSL